VLSTWYLLVGLVGQHSPLRPLRLTACLASLVTFLLTTLDRYVLEANHLHFEVERSAVLMAAHIRPSLLLSGARKVCYLVSLLFG
jgi:hypothetical protein